MRNSMRRIRRHVGVAVAHAALDIGGASDRVHDAGKFNQHAIAGEFDDAALMLGDFGVDQIFSAALERGERAGFVRAHQPAVTDDIGGKNSGQPAFHLSLRNLAAAVFRSACELWSGH